MSKCPSKTDVEAQNGAQLLRRQSQYDFVSDLKASGNFPEAFFVEYGVHRAVERAVERQREDEIAAAVHEVVGDAAYPIGQRELPAADEQIGDGAQRPEAQPERARDHRPDERGVVAAHEDGDHRQHRPEIPVAQPPQPEAEDQPLEHNVHPDRVQRLPAEEDRREDDEHGVDVYVRQRHESHFRREDKRAHYGQRADLPGGELTSRS